MRRKIRTGICLGLLAAMLCGCGGEYAERPSEASGPAISEDGEHGSSGETYPFCSDTNLYQTVRSDDTDGVIQTRLDGSRETLIPVGGSGKVRFVDVDWLYFERLDPDRISRYLEHMVTICRIPIKKDSEGYDVLRTDRVEDLVYGTEALYVDSEYILYTRADDDAFMKYDIRNQKEIPNPLEGDVYPGSCARCGDTFIMSVDSGLFIQSTRDTGWTRISDLKSDDIRAEDWNDQTYFYGAETGRGLLCESIQAYDVETRENKPFINKDELWQVVSRALGLEGKKEVIELCSIESINCEGDRLYVQVQVDWKEQNTKNMRYIILSKARREADLIYEKKLTELMHGCVRTNREEGEEGTEEISNDAQWIGIINGKVYLSLYDYDNKKGRLGCYELETDEFRWVTQSDPEYYEPYYEGWYGWNSDFEGYRLEGVFMSDSMDNMFTGIYW